MKFFVNIFLVGMICFLGAGHSVQAMEMIFGRKYPIQQNVNKDQLSWLSVEFEKDVTGKVIYKLEATHPQGQKISYLKGKDYLLSEDIQKNLIRNFEVKSPEVEFDSSKKAYFEIVLPYDFQTRYLPLKFEKTDGYQEVVLRLRFGDYRFMLASKTLNTVSNVETVSVAGVKTVEQLFAKRALLKARPEKVKEEQAVAAVNVDDIYDLSKKDLNIQSRIVTDVTQMHSAAEPQEEVMDEFDAVLSQYLPTEKEAQAVASVKNLVPTPSSQSRDISYDMSQVQQDVIKDPTTESDYNAYVENLIKDEKGSGEFNPNASVDDIIAQAGQFEQQAREAELDKKIINMDEKQLENYLNTMNGQAEPESEESQKTAQIKKPAYVPPVDTEALFGLPSDDWVEPKSAPVLVMKPKPVDQKRRIASFEAPKRNNFVEVTPPPKSAPAPAVNMDDLFGGGSGATPNGLGF